MISLRPTTLLRRSLFWQVLLFTLVLGGAARASGADADWIGHTRAEVVATLGKPNSALHRGDTEVLMFPNEVRVEIRADQVVVFRSGTGAVIVARDGTRYTPSDRGKVTKLDEATAAGVGAPPPPAPAPKQAATADEATEDPAAVVEETEADAARETTDAEAATDAMVAPSFGGATDQDTQLLKMTENYEDHGKLTEHEVKPPPAWFGPVRSIVAALLRFGFAMLVLRIAISWVGLPCYLPDVAKVSFLYVVIREAVSGLGGLGGHWEFIGLFMVPDVVGSLAQAVLLYRFKVVHTGITALKIVAMTQGVTYFLMLVVGLALTIGLGVFF